MEKYGIKKDKTLLTPQLSRTLLKNIVI